MSEPESIDLFERFPDMKPIKGPPTMFTLNGFGTFLLGKRDRDPETETHIATLFICAIFIPLIPIAAYRVSSAGSKGWYFHGKHPVSNLMRIWRYFILAGIVAIGLAIYADTPGYKARQSLKEIHRLHEAGDLKQATTGYLRLATTPETSKESIEGLREILSQDLSGASISTRVGVIAAVAPGYSRLKTTLKLDLETSVTKWTEETMQFDPPAALDLLSHARSIFKNDEAYAASRRHFLELAVAHPSATAETVSEYAVLLEGEGVEAALLRKLLEPHAADLGVSEGARILGVCHVLEGETEQAYALLRPYVKSRLSALAPAEKAWEQAVNASWDRAMKQLNETRVGNFDYDAYDKGDEEKQSQLVNEFAQKTMAEDRRLDLAREAYSRASAVVPVALDLGIIMLERSRDLPDPEAQRAELEAAEEIFLAISGVAGDSIDYRLFFAKVKYWLGKHEEGREQLELVLANPDVDVMTTLSVCLTLREVGDFDRARILAESAYERAVVDSDRFYAAQLRSVLYIDTADSIEWLERCDPDAVDIQASLASSRGDIALAESRFADADKLFRQSLKIYEGITPTSAVLNNMALVCGSLFTVSGKVSDHERGAQLMRESIALNPSGSVGLTNLTSSLRTNAVIQLTAAELDYSIFGESYGTATFGLLATNDAEMHEWRQRLKGHANIAECLDACKRLMLLAPRGVASYASHLDIAKFLLDEGALVELDERLKPIEFDLEQTVSMTLEAVKGEIDDEEIDSSKRYRKDLRARIARARGNSDKVTESALLVALARSQENAINFGLEVKSDELVQTAKAAMAAHPSLSASKSLVHAFLMRAEEALSTQSPAFKAIHDRTRHSLGSAYRTAAICDADTEIRALFLANADYQAAVAEVIRRQHEFPTMSTPWMWAFVRHTDAELAAEIAAHLKDDEIYSSQSRISLSFAPLVIGEAYDLLWLSEITGKDLGAEDVFKQQRAHGMPLPF